MSMTATLSLKKLEEHFGIQDQLSLEGYYSIFDIIHKTKTEFIKQHSGRWGAKAKNIYDVAASYATQIMLLSRKNKITQSFEKSMDLLSVDASLTSLYSNSSPTISPKNGPTWQTLFAENWSEYCQTSAPEANDSPVSYLSWLYNQALSYEKQMGENDIISLSTRRPDLAELMLDNDAVNQVVPSLQLVNEILEQSVTPYVSMINSKSTVSEVLATTRYPTQLPYHYPHQQALLSLKDSDESLQAVIKKADTTWPYFVKENLITGNAENVLLLGSDLAPEQLSIITEKANINADFYKENFGVECNNYSIFKDPAILCHQLNITKQQLEKVISCTEGGSSVVVSKNYPDGVPSPVEYGAKYINQNDSNTVEIIKDAGYDTISNSTSMVLTNTTIITGKFGDGINVDATKNAEAYITDDFSVKNNSSADFCLTFWCKLPADVKDGATIVTNKTGEYTGNAKGISLLVSNENNQVKFSLGINDGSKSLSVSADIVVDTWIFFCIAQDVTGKKLTCYYSINNIDMNNSSIDCSTLSSTALSDSYWGFNSNKGNQHYKSYPGQAGIMSFDDITVWNRLLTDDEINLFITSNFPAAEYTNMLHYYPLENYHLNNLSDSRLNNIQQMVRLQRWTDLPYDQIDTLMSTAPVINTEYSSMVLKNIYIRSGKFGDGIRVDATVGAEAYFPDDVSVVKGDSADFSLAFWCKLPADVKDGATIITNKMGEYSGNAKGISLLVKYTNSILQFTLNTSDGSTVLSQSVNMPTDAWVFFCLCQDVTAKKVYCYYSTDGATLLNVCNDYSTLSSIALSNTYWGFNSNKDNTHYKSYPEQESIIDFDDITVWNRKLSESEITKFITSNKPAAGYVTMIYNFSFENIQNSSELVMDPRKLTTFNHYQKKYNVNSQQFSAVLDVISPYAITPDVPFLDQVFNSSSLFDEPLKINNTSFNYTVLDNHDGQIVKQICAGLGITHTQFLLLANQVNIAQKMAKNTLTCSLPVISALYRLVMVPRWLGLSFAEGLSLLMLVENGNALNKLASVPFYTVPNNNGQCNSSDLLNTLMALSDAAQWLADNNLTATGVLSMLQAGNHILPATTAEINFIAGINQQLPSTLLNENCFSSLPRDIISESVYCPNGMNIGSLYNNTSYELNSTDKQYACLSDKANDILNPGSNISSTLGMWCYIKNGASLGVPLIASATIESNGNAETGIAITLGDGYKFNISMKDANGESADISSDTAKWNKNDTWFYLTLRMPGNGMLCLDVYSDDGKTMTSSTLDYNKIGNCNVEGNRWAINEDGSQKFYSTHSSKKKHIFISDVTVWQKNISNEEVESIIQSCRPANETVPGGIPFIKSTWMDSLNNLIDHSGLVLPIATDYQTISTIVHNDLCYGTSESQLNEVSNIIYQAKLAQQNIADSALAKAFNIDHSYPPYLLAWAASSEYDLLSQSLALNGITTPDTIPDEYQQYLYQIARRAGLCNTFNLTPAMLSTLLAHPAWFGVADTTIDFNLLYLFSRYSDWMKLADKEDAMLAYLRRVNGTPSPTPEQAASCLALLTDWESDEVLQAAAHADPATGIATTLAHIDVVMRLKTLCTHTGTSVETMLNTGDLTTTSTYQEWQSVGESLVAAQSNH
ncbi:virulence protein SpvA [Salmonella enterica]|nr:virulence protein SpvA [Salmonella enterica]EKK6346711.1 virulence protein SpvA [Salmonella enterica]ELO7821620.1 virulence protein SpvA [Salmonella enterica]ELR6878415.1 virulence protein SpvA [Salmonella enterica]MJK45240.1 virulence protein SpvA [Salmonella enterica subsp. diarizonae]